MPALKEKYVSALMYEICVVFFVFVQELTFFINYVSQL